jgi:protein involved in polysaccharide export with SLBB domain
MIANRAQAERNMSNPSRLLLPIVVLAAMILASLVGAAQSDGIRSQAVPKTAAEMEADEKVSLSAEKVIAILQSEPGLLLQVKKLLVRKAYEQGRILESSDLTDLALFQLLREDENIRVLATREIENRYYVRAKPTREEVEREDELANSRSLSRASAGDQEEDKRTDNLKSASSQEDVYWSKQQRQKANRVSPGQDIDTTTPDFTPHQQEPARAPSRVLDRASLRENQDGFATAKYDTGTMERVRPEQLSDLLNPASASIAEPRQSAIDRLQDEASNVPLFAGRADSNDSRGSRTPLDPKLTSARHPSQPSGLNADRPILTRKANPYADVPALYDLYTQVNAQTAPLERFGINVFRNDNGTFDDLPMDLPAGPDYVLGPGDGLNLELWGSLSQRLQRVVDREGRLALPEVGTLQVSGRTLADVQHLVQAAMRTQFHDVEADISLSRIRAVRVYVVGDVATPGAYDISSLSTPLNALYAAGGPTERGSLRRLRHYRGEQLVQEIDAYDLLLNGIHGHLATMQSGDTILVPPMGAQVTVQGMVRRPAVYELNHENNLAEVLELAGGVLPSGTLRHIDVDRLIVHENRVMLQLDLPQGNGDAAVNQALDGFSVQDGDKIRIAPILPYSEKTIYLDGHVFHPGKYPYREGMKVTDVLHSYSDLLPEPAASHAEVIRLQPPDYSPLVMSFNLADAMQNTEQNIVLKPFDTIRIFGRYDFEDQPRISVTGAVRDPGEHVTNGVTRLKDAIALAGGISADAETADAQVFRREPDGKLKVLSASLAKAFAGDETNNLLLQPKDRIFIQRNLANADPAVVLIQGEVARPGKYPLGREMTATDLVRLAGGLKRGADTDRADLARYLDAAGSSGDHRTLEIAKAMAGVPGADAVLHDGDVLTIRQTAGFKDLGSVITVKGEVVHPGTFGIREGERLSSVLARAGGFRPDAFPYGALLERSQIRDLEERNRADLIRRVEAEGAQLKLIPEVDGDQKAAKDASLMQWQSALEKLKSVPPSGRMVIQISQNVRQWANTSADIELRAGDTLTIPKTPNFVMVDGAVYNPTAITFRPGKDAEWYLRQAGGGTNMANKKAIFLIRANGSVVGGSGGLFTGGVLDAEVRAGDVIVVPEKAYSGTSKWKNTLQVAQLVSAIGIGVQVARGF